MLVLSRKPSQEIVIGDRIRVSVIKIQGNSVRLGIAAPKDVRILRSELAEWHEFSFGPADDSSDAAGAASPPDTQAGSRIS